MEGIYGVSIFSFAFVNVGSVLYLFLEKYLPHILYYYDKDEILAFKYGNIYLLRPMRPSFMIYPIMLLN